MTSTALPASPGRRGLLDRLMRLAADVQPGEAATALLLALNVFLLLAAYYVIKPVREALILTGGGAELKSYSGAVQAALLLFIVPAYGAFASKVNRIRLINAVTLFFISNLVLFYLLSKTKLPLGVPFFLWVGIFNVMVIAQFWSFANDLYTPEQGKRLFAIVGLGSVVGAAAGSKVAETTVGMVGVYGMMLVAAGLLLLSLLLANVINAREKGGVRADARRKIVDEPLGREGGFELVFRHRYLLFIGLLTLMIQLINTNGEYILGRGFSRAAREALAAGTAGGLSEEDLIAGYSANFYLWQNVFVTLIQFLLVSRILKYLGVRGALFIPPVVSLGGYTLIAFTPVLANIRMAKIFENSTDYSLENTVRHSLFLPTSREAKYKAKQVVDSFFWRAGDMVSALAVFGGIRLLGLGSVAAINAALVALWLLIAFGIAREHRKLEAEGPEQAGA